MVIGSQAWCDYWANWYMARALRTMQRETLSEFQIVCVMEWLFTSYAWRDTKPWH